MWALDLVDAVDHDNREDEVLTCGRARTLAILRAAPDEVRDQADLAVADFTATTREPLPKLRSDTVARSFSVKVDRLNMPAGRMLVPGGTRPGEFRLEAVVFQAELAQMPPEFPAVPLASELHFGEIIASSSGYALGSGAVLFPDLLSVRDRLKFQAFGVVFAARLTSMFEQLLPLLHPATFELLPPSGGLTKLRKVSFLAHEWGHEQLKIEQALEVRRHRLIAVVAELHADLAALSMLVECPGAMAWPTAMLLVADRIGREAWLTRPYAQVQAIVARQLLSLLVLMGAATVSGGRLIVELRHAIGAIREELARVEAVGAACFSDGAEPARNYLREHGWLLINDNCFRESENPVERFLEYAATKR